MLTIAGMSIPISYEAELICFCTVYLNQDDRSQHKYCAVLHAWHGSNHVHHCAQVQVKVLVLVNMSEVFHASHERLSTWRACSFQMLYLASYTCIL